MVSRSLMAPPVLWAAIVMIPEARLAANKGAFSQMRLMKGTFPAADFVRDLMDETPDREWADQRRNGQMSRVSKTRGSVIKVGFASNPPTCAPSTGSIRRRDGFLAYR